MGYTEIRGFFYYGIDWKCARWLHFTLLIEWWEILGHFLNNKKSNFCNNNDIKYESNGDKNKNLSRKEYLNKIEPCFGDMIIDLQNFKTWKIQLTIAIDFVSSRDVQEERVMYSKSNNIKFTSYNDTNEVANELFNSLRSRYQDNLEKSMRGSEYIFDSVQLMHYKCHRV